MDDTLETSEVLTTKETSSAAPALACQEFVDGTSASFVAWRGTNAQQQLNVMSADTSGKITFPPDGTNAATSVSGPSLIFKTAPDSTTFLVISWAGLPGGTDHDNHLSIISSFSNAFTDFDQRRTVQPVSSKGPAVIDITKAADADVLCAWVDKREDKENKNKINTAKSYNRLTVILAS
jgi:hypothetical protein